MHQLLDAEPVPELRQFGEQRAPGGAADPLVAVPLPEVDGRASREHGRGHPLHTAGHRLRLARTEAGYGTTKKKINIDRPAVTYLEIQPGRTPGRVSAERLAVRAFTVDSF